MKPSTINKLEFIESILRKTYDFSIRGKIYIKINFDENKDLQKKFDFVTSISCLTFTLDNILREIKDLKCGRVKFGKYQAIKFNILASNHGLTRKDYEDYHYN